MSPPSLSEAVSALLLGKEAIISFLTKLENVSPEFIKGEEQAVIDLLNGIEIPDPVLLVASLDAAKQVVVTGKGLSGGGADASLA